MAKIILKRTPAEDVWYNFEDEVYITYEVNEQQTVVIAGNNDFREFGDKTLLDIIEGDYYDEDKDENGETIGYDYETFEELKKVTGKDWEVRTMSGYSQGDWQEIYYAVGLVSEERLAEIENFYFGKVDEFFVSAEDEDDSYVVYIPHNVVWKGKEAICKYLAIKPEETTILVDNGYHRVYDYEEME